LPTLTCAPISFAFELCKILFRIVNLCTCLSVPRSTLHHEFGWSRVRKNVILVSMAFANKPSKAIDDGLDPTINELVVVLHTLF